MIVGVVGTICSGKGTFCDILRKEYGFNEALEFSREVGEFISEDLASRGPIDRERKQFWGNEARKLYGKDYWERRLFLKVNGGNDVVDSFKYIDQILNFQKRYGKFPVIGFDADPEIRFERVLKRKRVGDPKTWEEFLEVDRRDKEGYKTQNGQDTLECLRLSDKIFITNGTLDLLRGEVYEYLESISLRKVS